ncbi:P450 heme-thiolate protein [Methylobacterium sp. ME121]|nr:P450 heme-thiolate protein [Methylobacterium sp. ME121]
MLPEAELADDRLESMLLRAFVSAVASVLLIVPADSAPLIVSDIRVWGDGGGDHRCAASCAAAVDVRVLMTGLGSRMSRIRPAAGPCANYPRGS